MKSKPILTYCLILLSVFLIMPDLAHAEGNLQNQVMIFVDDTLIKTPGRLFQGSTMMPLRNVLEEVGAYVSWNPEEHRIVITKDRQRIELAPEKDSAKIIPDEEITLDQPVMTLRGTSWLPLRSILELFDLQVAWEEEHQVVRITTGNQEEKLDDLIEQIDVSDMVPDEDGENVVYLTFDDGPSYITPGLLDILDEYNAKATFFVIGQEVQAQPHIVRRIHQEGHLVGNHSFIHHQEKLYASTESFEEEVIQAEEVIQGITGERPRVFRPPYGAHPDLTEEHMQVLRDRGYHNYFWNVSSGDTAAPPPGAEVIAENVLTGIQNTPSPIVLLHDSRGKENTKKAVEQVLRELTFEGYQFEVLPH